METNQTMAIYNKGLLNNNTGIVSYPAGDISYPTGPANHSIGIDYFYHNYYYPCCYPTTTYEKSKIEQAFKIVHILFKKKIIEVKTVKEFVDLVDEISKVV